MNDLPSPLTPTDCDLRDFPRMMIDITRLRQSSFDAIPDDTAWRAGFNLWMSAFHSVPAASLDDDEAVLCKAAGLGRDLKTWRKIKSAAMRGWLLCSDGRWYHETVAEFALEAWLEKLAQRLSSGAGNAKRWGTIFDPEPIKTAIVTTTALLAGLNPASKSIPKSSRNMSRHDPDGMSNRPGGTPDSVPSGSQEKGQGRERNIIPIGKPIGRSASAELPLGEPPKAEKPADPWAPVYKRGREILGNSAGGVITNLRKTFHEKPRKVLAKLEDAAEQREPLVWINAFLWQHGPPGLEGIDTNGGFV